MEAYFCHIKTNRALVNHIEINKQNCDTLCHNSKIINKKSKL